MLRGLYVAASALVAKSEVINVTSNNLANAQTMGYKKDLVTYEPFENVLIAKINGQYRNDEGPGDPINVKQVGDIYTLETLEGYFEVDGKNGISQEKSVKFLKNEDGYLSTFYKNGRGEIIKDKGYRLQGENGDIFIGDNDYEVNDQGQVIVNGAVADQLLHYYAGHIIGTMSSGIHIDRVVTNHEQGELQGTDNPLDFALMGDGFFEVETPNGTRYTRAGLFTLNRDYELVTSEGFNVVGFDGPIVLGNGTISVNDFGEITLDGEIVDKFKVVNPENIHELHKEGSNYYYMNADMIDLGFEGQIAQGFLESSNVNTVREMIEMMEIYRNFESNQRLVTTYDATLDKAINEVGVV